MEARTATGREIRRDRMAGLPAWLLGLVPLLLIIAALGTFAALGGPGLSDRRGPPAEELAVENPTASPAKLRVSANNRGARSLFVMRLMPSGHSPRSSA